MVWDIECKHELVINCVKGSRKVSATHKKIYLKDITKEICFITFRCTWLKYAIKIMLAKMPYVKVCIKNKNYHINALLREAAIS